MAIVGYPGWPPVIDANTREHVRFAMSDGRRLIPCRISIDALRDCFGDENSEPIDLFESCQTAIEDAAGKKHEAVGTIDGIVELNERDFD
ncbi:DUF1488 family protein [Methylobacterium sp. CM6257]|jgi:hypothetical protein